MTTKTKPAAAGARAATSLPKSPSKSALVLRLLARAKGATIADMAEPTGWQPHSNRALLSGLRKNGHTLIRELRKTGETAYRIIDAASSKAATAGTTIANAPTQSSDSTEASGHVGDRIIATNRPAPKATLSVNEFS